MSKTTITLDFTAPIIGYDKKIKGYAHIVGLGYWNPSNTEWDYCYADFDIQNISVWQTMDVLRQPAIHAYYIDKGLMGDFSEAIDKLIYDNMEFQLFGTEINKAA